MSNQLTTVQPVRASDQLASFLGIEKGMMLDTLKAQCFKGKRPDEVSDAQLAAFVSTANALQVNPLLPGFLYAYPERNGGITPILGPDGTFKKLDEMISSGKLKGYKCDVKMGADGKPESATAIIQRGEGQLPAEYTAYFSEWCVTSNPNWQSRPRHMLWVRAIKQAARQVIHGLPMDADEYEIAQMHNVTPEDQKPEVDRAPVPERKKRQPKGTQAIDAEVVNEAPPQEQKPVEQASAEKKVDPKPVESFTEAAAATEAPEKAQAPAEPLAQVEPPKPRAFLQDKEEIMAVVTVAELSPLNITQAGVAHPSVKAKLKGGFEGEVYHIGGGVADGATVKPAAPWAVGATLTVKLLGKINAKAGGKVQVFVQSVAVAQQAGTEVMEA